MADLRLEVDRFDWASEERLEVVGRWHGIRGRVFLRPTLDVRGDDGPRRLLAVLDHKPWIAQEGEEWIVAFPWSGPRELEHADLAVGSGTVVALPLPGTGGTARPPVAEVPTAAAEPAPEPEPEVEEPPEPVNPAELEQAHAERDTAIGARDAALEQWRRAQEELEQMRAEVAAAEERRRVADQARDEAVAEADQARSRLRTAESERDFAQQERDGAERRRQEALGSREEAARELHRASSSRAEVEARHNEIAAERDEATAARDEAQAALKAVTTERDTMREQRDAARAERDEITAAPSPGPVLPPAVVRSAAHAPHRGLRLVAAGALVVLAVVIAVLIAMSL